MGITYPHGFRAGAARCGIKKEGLDLALVVSDTPAISAGVFTTNRCCAAPVKLSRSHVNSKHVQAILANSGNANAATGEEGYRAAVCCAEEAAYRLGCSPTEVLVASTGVIGVPLPTDRIVGALDKLVGGLAREGGRDAAEAILTTDTCAKEQACECALSGGVVRLGGIAKGAGMIMPNMATMLAFITTDAEVERHQIQRMLRAAVDASFNKITVDGDTSTNDCVFLLANGNSGVKVTEDDEPAFEQAIEQICVELAKLIVRDGEGATKFVAVEVEGCASEGDADAIARTIANSPLVKTALYGSHPNWGRIIAAAGRAGVAFDADNLDVYLNGILVVKGGVRADADMDMLKSALARAEIEIRVVLSEGEARATVWTCDLSHKYIDINVAYN